MSVQCMATIQTHDLLRKFTLFLSREEQCVDICVCLEGSHTLCLLGKAVYTDSHIYSMAILATTVSVHV